MIKNEKDNPGHRRQCIDYRRNRRRTFIEAIFPAICLAVLCFAGQNPMLFAAEAVDTPLLSTAAERSAYTQTTLYEEVMQFIFAAQAQTDIIKIANLGTSIEGRNIPLVIISKEGVGNPQELRLSNKPAVLINANIHAGEVEGKEATLMLIREFAQGRLDALLENQAVLVIPVFNPDGNEKLGKNRHDNGPELAGIRANGQNLDLNRDFLKLESPEVRALVRLFDSWEPVLFVDLHTTNGSFHREPVTYGTGNNPNSDPTIMQYMWEKLLPGAAVTLKNKYGYDSVPYGNFIDHANPNKGWEYDGFEPRYSTNYAGLRNMFAILDENYSYADFKTRVLACYGYVRSILEYTAEHIGEMQHILDRAQKETAHTFFKGKFTLEQKNVKLMDVTVKSFVFKKEKIKPEDRDKYPPWFGEYLVSPTSQNKDYLIPYFAKADPTVQINLPQAYIIAPYHEDIIRILKDHGIRVEKTVNTVKARVEKYTVENIELAKNMYQGHVPLTIKGKYEEEEITILPGSYYISMEQPLARLIAALLEPGYVDSLAAWGFFNRELVRQWSRTPGLYPVYRFHGSSRDIALQSWIAHE